MDFTIEGCVHFSKTFCTPKVGEKLIVRQREEGDPNDVYRVAVKTNGTKTVRIQRNNDLSSFQLHSIDFVLAERKLAHCSVKFPAPFCCEYHYG